MLNWNWELGIPTNPEATAKAYQVENLDYFGFKLTTAELATLNNWSSR